MEPPTRRYRGVTPSERIEQRRSQLIDAAVHVFGTVGYRSATVDQVCARAGLSKRYFYESFTDSEALLLASYEHCAEEVHDALVTEVAGAPDDIDAQLRAALTGYFTAIDADQHRARITLLEILGVSPAIDAAYAHQTARFATSIEGLAATSFQASSLPQPQLHVIAQGIVGAVTTIALQWLLERRRRPRAQLIEATHVMVLAVLERLPHT